MDDQHKSPILKFFIERLNKWEKYSPPNLQGGLYIVGILIVFSFVLSLVSCDTKITLLYFVILTIILILSVVGTIYLKQRDTRKAQIQKQFDEVEILLRKFIAPDLRRRERIFIVAKILDKFRNFIQEPEQQKEFERKLKILDDLATEREERILPNFGEWQKAEKWLERNQSKLIKVSIDNLIKNNTLPAINQVSMFEESIYAHLQLIRTELKSGGEKLQELNFSQVTPRMPTERDAYREVFISVRKEIKKGHKELSELGQLVILYFLDILVEEYD